MDLPDHPAVQRVPASEVDPDSDLGSNPVVVGCAPLSATEIDAALTRGLTAAEAMRQADLIVSAALFLQGESRTLGPIARIAKETVDA